MTLDLAQQRLLLRNAGIVLADKMTELHVTDFFAIAITS